MATIISGKPNRTCPSCGCKFEFTKSDIHMDIRQKWVGFFKGGWETIEIRWVDCPGCGKHLKLN